MTIRGRYPADLRANAQTHPNEWLINQHALLKHDMPIVFPVYTLAPLSCADDFSNIAVDFLISIAEDPAYEGREIVVSGLSAGGWCALRMIFAACEEAIAIAGSDSQADTKRQERIISAVRRIRQVVLWSPCSSMEVTEELRQADKTVSRVEFHHPLGVWTNVLVTMIETSLYLAIAPDPCSESLNETSR
jgi:hypothetical protein